MSSYEMSQLTSTAPPNCAASTWPGERALLVLVLAVDRGTSSKHSQRTHTAAARPRIPPSEASSATNGHAAATEANGTGTGPSPVKKDKDEGFFECCVCGRQVRCCSSVRYTRKVADHPTLADRRGAVRESLERLHGPRRFETEWRTGIRSSGSSKAERLSPVRLKSLRSFACPRPAHEWLRSPTGLIPPLAHTAQIRTLQVRFGIASGLYSSRTTYSY